MAQGYAFGSIAKDLMQENRKKINKAFLVGVTNAKFEKAGQIPVQGDLFIQLETEREMLPMILFKGTVLDCNNLVLAEARLKVFAGE